MPAPAEADRPSSEGLPADLVARAKATGLERSRNPETDRPRWYLVAADHDRLCCWEAGDADGWYWTRRSDAGGILVDTEADALRAWLDSREGAERPSAGGTAADLAEILAGIRSAIGTEPSDTPIERDVAALVAERDAATQEADRLRTRLVDAEAERDRLRRGLLTEFSLAEAELDRDALLAYLAYTGGCTHEGIGLPGCPTCEGRWTRDVRAAVHARRDRAHPWQEQLRDPSSILIWPIRGADGLRTGRWECIGPHTGILGGDGNTGATASDVLDKVWANFVACDESLRGVVERAAGELAGIAAERDEARAELGRVEKERDAALAEYDAVAKEARVAGVPDPARVARILTDARHQLEERERAIHRICTDAGVGREGSSVERVGRLVARLAVRRENARGAA